MRWTWQYLGLLVVVVMVIYGSSIGNGFIFEDQAELKRLPERSADAVFPSVLRETTSEGAWRPVSRWTLLKQKAMSGATDPVPFRAFNFILQAGVALAAYGFLRQVPLGIRRVPAFFAALLLVAHPVASTNIYRICEGRDILLALLFTMGSAAFFLRGGWYNLAVAALLYALALGSHELAIGLPLALGAAEAAGLTEKKAGAMEGREPADGDSGPGHLFSVPVIVPPRVKWMRVAPFLVLAGLFLLLRRTIVDGAMAGQTEPRLPGVESLYALLALVAPSRSVIHHPVLTGWLTGWRIAAGAGLAVLLALAVMIGLRHPDALLPARRREELRRLAFWIAWWAASLPLLPALLPGGATFYEGQAQALSLAFWGMIAWTISRYWDWEAVRPEIWVFGSAAAVLLAAITLGRQGYYRDDGAFLSQWTRTNPDAWRAYVRRSGAWLDAGRVDLAEQQVERGLMLKPDAAELLAMRGSVWEKKGLLEEALRSFQDLASAHPTNWEVRVRAADLTFKLGRVAEAVDQYAALVNAFPGNPAVSNKLEEARKAESGKIP